MTTDVVGDDLGMFWIAATAAFAAWLAAFDRGDLDDTARRGARLGPVVVEQALRSPQRGRRLAAIVSAPAIEDRVELLAALAEVAGGSDRRSAIPAARAARTIARELARHGLADDLAADDVAGWRASYEQLARRADRWVEVRLAALDTAAALAHAVDPTAIGFDLAAALADRDPALRARAAALVPMPAPAGAHAALASAVADDADPSVALAAAQALCAELGSEPARVTTALGARGLDRIRALVADRHTPAARDAARCLPPR